MSHLCPRRGRWIRWIALSLLCSSGEEEGLGLAVSVEMGRKCQGDDYIYAAAMVVHPHAVAHHCVLLAYHSPTPTPMLSISCLPQVLFTTCLHIGE
jgi:hypothetical protein